MVSEQPGVTKKFTPAGKFITKWGSRGSGEGQFLHLHDIELDSYGNMYIVDQDNFKIHKFTKDGKFIKSWGSDKSEQGPTVDPH